MIRFIMIALVLNTSVSAAAALADDTAEIKLLKAKIETLEAKLEAATLKIEKLQKLNEELKENGLETTETPNSDTVETPANLRAKVDNVEYELLRCVRDPMKPTRVMFTFGLMCNQDNPLHYALHQISLTDYDGAAIDVKVVKGPPLQRDMLGIQRAHFNLPKDKQIKFQIVVDGVREEITQIDSVELTTPPLGLVIVKATFTKVKVVSQKKAEGQ